MKHIHSIRRRSLAATAAAAVGVLFFAFAFPAVAHDGEHHTAISADEIVFNPGPPTLPPGAEFAVLMGNPGEEGPFALRLKFPAGYKVPPHRHTKEEHVTVISGGFGIGAGEMFEPGDTPMLPAGSFVQIPIGMAHFAWVEGETVVQINGIGPFDIQYVDPDDDPRAQ